MQNRSNRSLLFGARATAGADPAALADAEAVEADNQLGVEHLRSSAGTMKEIALNIETDVADQNRMLDRMDKRFDSANSLVAQTMNALNDMVNDRTSTKMCGLIGVIFIILFLIYQLLKH